MPRSVQWYAIRIGALWSVSMVCACFLAAQASGDTVYHLHGTVRDGVSNKPIGRALVTSGDRRLAAMTDSEGHFAIDLSVPAKPGSNSPSTPDQARFGSGNTLSAQRPGYLRLEQQTAFALDDSLNTTDIALKLMPAAAIAGRVSASGTNTTRGIRVTLLRRQVVEGVFTWVHSGSHTTGSNGDFRFTELQPGEYTVMTAEWAGGEPVALQRSAITRQYPPDFLGNTATLAAAAKLHLHYGSEERVELHLHAATYYPVVVPVQNQPPNSPISVRLGGSGTFNGFQLAWNARDGAVEGSLPSGQYTLQLTSFGPQQGSAQVPLTVANQPLEHAPVALAEGSRIPIRVHMEWSQNGTGNSSDTQGYAYAGPAGGAPSPSNPVQLYLRPADEGGGFAGSSMRRDEGSEEALENVQPGTYYVHASTIRGYISRLTSGGIDLLRQPITIGDGGSADPIDVTLRDDGGTVEGTLKTEAGGQLTTFAALLLVPADGSGLAQQSYAMPNSGKFTLRNVSPGSYRLFAMMGGNALRQLPYRDPEAMRAYAGKGTAVTVTAGQTSTADASVLDAAEIAP